MATRRKSLAKVCFYPSSELVFGQLGRLPGKGMIFLKYGAFETFARFFCCKPFYGGTHADDLQKH